MATDVHKDLHKDLHSERGAVRGEHPGRSSNPLIKVADLAWLEFEKPDLTRAEAFARAFGFQTAQRTPTELHLRGTDAGAPCVLLRHGPRTRFGGLALRAADEVDVLRIADATGAGIRPLPEVIGGVAVDLTDPSGTPVRVVAGMHALPDTPVLANTGVKHATIADVLKVADGCIVGSSLKVDGDTWKPVDPERAAEFMRLARAARGE